MTSIVIFEDDAARRFEPLALTRPLSELRCGILTQRQALESELDARTTRLQVRSFLAEVASELVQADPDAEEALFLNARTFVREGLAAAVGSLAPGQSLCDGHGNVVASRGPVEHAQPIVQTWPTHEYPWHLFERNAELIIDQTRFMRHLQLLRGSLPGVHVVGGFPVLAADDVVVQPMVVLDATAGPVVLDRGAVVMSGSVLQGPTYVGVGSTIKMGARIYHGTTIGPNCKVGGEVEETIFLGHSNKQHDGFLGHSLVGEWCNLGANTTNSDLKNNYGPVRVWSADKWVDTGSQFVGLHIGDHSKTGIGTMFNTGTVVGVACNVFGAGLPPKFLPSFSWGGCNTYVEHDPDLAIATARQAMARRGRTLTVPDEAVLRHVFDATAHQRASANK